jgi:hypothetical protein
VKGAPILSGYPEPGSLRNEPERPYR